ncbi:MAG TPA: hypothetical protein VGR51_00595, partial [Thermoplasmata archaeon]|nr:hypothetical protein [Thermoplasmata archaeon]
MFAGFGVRTVFVVLTAVALVAPIGNSVTRGPSDPLAPPPTPVPFAAYTGFPSLDPDDGKFMAVAGNDLSTLGGVSVVLYAGIPAETSTFEIGVFDGDTGSHWDSRQDSPVLVYRLYKDPLKSGSTANLLSEWTSETLLDDDWSTNSFATDAAARAPSGNFFYRLDVNWQTPSDRSFN